MRSQQRRLGILAASQYVLEYRGKSAKLVSRWPIAGSSGRTLTSRQLSDERNAETT
jgi:hypothetical protein